MIGAPVPILFRGAAKFGHGDDGDVLHTIAHILRERHQCPAKFAQQVWQLAEGGALAHFLHMRVPAAYVSKRHFEADIRLDEASDLLQALSQPAVWIHGAVRRTYGFFWMESIILMASNVSRPVVFSTRSGVVS